MDSAGIPGLASIKTIKVGCGENDLRRRLQELLNQRAEVVVTCCDDVSAVAIVTLPDGTYITVRAYPDATLRAMELWFSGARCFYAKFADRKAEGEEQSGVGVLRRLVWAAVTQEKNRLNKLEHASNSSRQRPL